MNAGFVEDRRLPSGEQKTARQPPARGSTIGRAFEIFLRITAYLFWLLGERLSLVRHPTAAQKFADVLQGLGTSFVKLGQHLSLRSDLFPPDYLAELQRLQDNVKPFPASEAMAAIEHAFGKPPSLMFIRFDEEPFAAASVAQVHGARTFGGREVIVKVLRPGVAIQVDRDMRILAALVRFLSRFSSLLMRYKAEDMVHEVRLNLKKELDLREEAHAVRRMANAFRDSETIEIPDIVDNLCSETVLVQERSVGCRIDQLANPHQGPKCAQMLIDAYVEMFFVLGFFHGDPHPGNIFVTDTGKLAMHDFGIVGSLDRSTRHALAAFMLAFTEQDTEWVLDSWLELGMLTASTDRPKLRPAVAAVMSDYSRRPISDWSIGEAFGQLVTVSRGHNFAVPMQLLVLARTIVLIEATVRLLDPEFSLLDSLTARSREVMEAALSGETTKTRRLQFETAVAATEWQRMLASTLRKFREEGIRFHMDHEGLPELASKIVKGASMMSLALVTLGLYLAASLLMQYAMGPRVLGFHLLSLLFYLMAAWFTFRLVRGIGRRF